MPSKRQMRLRANLTRSIGFCWDPALPVPMAGISERLRAEFPRIKVVAVEPVGSVTFGGRPGKRNIPGIGASVRPKLADLAKPDRIVAVKEERTVEACLSFVRNYHLLVGGSTGTVLARCTAASSRVQSRRHHSRHIRGPRRKVPGHYL